MIHTHLDMAGAIAKTRQLKGMSKAHKYQLTDWLTRALLMLKQSAASMQKSGKGKKSGQMARSLGMEIAASGGGYVAAVGTGVGRGISSKYARIQDEGGITRPKITPRSRKFFWAQYYKTGDEKWLRMALTKQTVFTVVIPRSQWFTEPIEKDLKPLLDWMMDPAQVLPLAERMAGGARA